MEKKKTHVSSRDCDSLGETTVQIECYSGRTIYQKINFEIHWKNLKVAIN